MPQEFTRGRMGRLFFTQQKRVFFCSPSNSTWSTNWNSHQGKPTTSEDVNKNTTSRKQPRDAYKAASALLKPAGLAATKAAMMELTCAFNDGIVENPVVISDQQPTGFVQKNFWWFNELRWGDLRKHFVTWYHQQEWRAGDIHSLDRLPVLILRIRNRPILARNPACVNWHRSQTKEIFVAVYSKCETKVSELNAQCSHLHSKNVPWNHDWCVKRNRLTVGALCLYKWCIGQFMTFFQQVKWWSSSGLSPCSSSSSQFTLR